MRNDATRYVIATTDPDWFAFLRAHRPREVNFWRPSGVATHVAQGAPWFYQLHGEIVGCAFFVAYSKMPMRMAWDTFGEANGFATYAAFLNAIAARRKEPTTSITEIGCAALVDPIYFERPVRYGRMYGPIASQDTRDADGARLWDVLIAAMKVSLAEEGSSPVLPGGKGAPTLTQHRLGQSSFRTAVLAAYEQRCAVTGERTLPVLEAAHIRPFSEHPQHDVRNGLLLRSDLHTLFDAGLVTVGPDLRFRVSSQIKERYANGREYYALEGATIRAPRSPREAPLLENLNYHRSKVFVP